MSSLRHVLFRRTTPGTQQSTEQPALTRSMGTFQLSMLGIGATVGTGIFIVFSQAVPVAGPAVIWSFVIAAVVAGLTALCYAEMASAIPASGSSYSYAYATLGEFPALAVGACLLLEYGVSGAAVAVGWSEYLNQALENLFGVRIPEALSSAPEAGGVVNLPAIALVAMCTLLLVRGVRESAKANAAMVMIKLAVLVMFIVVGVTGWNQDHFSNFAPMGIAGITGAAGIIFFSYIGLDAVSTAGNEAKNPSRTMPLAIIITLGVVTALYIAVAVVAIGAQETQAFEGQEAGLAAILQTVTNASWPGTVLALAAIVSIFSVTLVVLYGQTRIFFAMSTDGLVPPVFSRVNARTRTPIAGTFITGSAVAVLAGLLPISFLAEMTSIGTLVAFIVVALAVIIRRAQNPNQPAPFKVPLYPVVPILSIIGCLWIIKDLRPVTLIAFIAWLLLATAFYITYSIRHSRLRQAPAKEPLPVP
ncbi:amino acid permease [Paenarthrobacter sp. GOM3]|uniref:amino acid permease n=1 Tax=Paenarthrobacter sp. GOM3 TaxID=2782567 RepID=UPI001BAAFC8D|nr:amino acid permease [Paenarthrobacter sp. GOM3]WOH20495.1 amino acid permease [Paenarthrobacter sp. GOM3]